MRYLGRYLSRLLGRSLTFMLGALPACVQDIAVSWHANLSNIQVDSGVDLSNFEKISSSASEQTLDIEYGNSIFCKVVFDSGLFVKYSSDNGDSWSTSTIPATITIPTRIRYINSLFILIGENSSGYPIISTTTDFVTWSTAAVVDTVSYSNFLVDVAYNSGTYVFSGLHPNEGVYTTTNLTSFINVVVDAGASAGGNLEGVVYDGSNFVVTVNQGDYYSYKSSNGSSWTPGLSGQINTIESPSRLLNNNTIVFSGLIAGQSYPISISDDSGDTWTGIEIPNFGIQGVGCATSNGSDLMVIKSGATPITVAYTHDVLAQPIQWNLYDIDNAYSSSRITYGNMYFMFSSKNQANNTFWIDRLNISASNNYTKESIGEDTRDVYYGQYLSSGTINFGTGRTGTFDYTDPSTGNPVTGVAMGTAVSVPVNGICDIITSDGSEYPCVEGVGTVLHDIEQADHIGVTSPVWDKDLNGSDHLNQHGFLTKADNDAEGEDWETLVEGSPVTLDNNCLIPLKKKSNELIAVMNATLNFTLG